MGLSSLPRTALPKHDRPKFGDSLNLLRASFLSLSDFMPTVSIFLRAINQFLGDSLKPTRDNFEWGCAEWLVSLCLFSFSITKEWSSMLKFTGDTVAIY